MFVSSELALWARRAWHPPGGYPGASSTALRHPDEGPTYARLCGGIPAATRGLRLS